MELDEDNLREEHKEMNESKEMEIEDYVYEHDPTKPHPLEIPDILGHLLKFVNGPGNMKSCRLVNSTWNLETCKVLQKRLTVTFLDKHSISTYMATFNATETVFPHSTFQFYNTEFDSSNPPLNQFLNDFGGRVKTLKLQLQTISFDFLHNILRQSLPNLQSLHLRCIPVTVEALEQQAGGSLRTFPNIQVLTLGIRDFMLPDTIGSDQWNIKVRYPFEKLLNRFPNVRKISLCSLDNSLTPQICDNVLAAVMAQYPNRLRYLSSLDFPIEADEKVLLGLTTLNCPYLNNLDLTFTSYMKPQTVINFFTMIGPNLTKLSLSFPNSYGCNFQHGKPLGQALRNVKDMTLSRFKWKMGFLEYMVHLKKLVFKDTDVGFIFPSNINLEIDLDVLRIESSSSTEEPLPHIPAPVLNDITRVFPRLKVLHIPGLTDECLRVIYFNLPCLTTFECVKGEFTDYGVTGVCLEICRDLAETTTYLVVNSDKLRSNLFIGNLTNLKTLRLEADAIDDLAILFGVAKCKSLQDLYLKSPSITDVGIEAITTHLGHEGSLQTLNVLHCPEVTEAGRFYIRESIIDRKILVEAEPNVDNERSSELCSATRFHRYCDAFVRRKLVIGRANGRFDDDGIGPAGLIAGGGPGRRSWLLNHHRMHVYMAHGHSQHGNLPNPAIPFCQAAEHALFGDLVAPPIFEEQDDDDDQEAGEEDADIEDDDDDDEEYFGPAGAVGGENIEQDIYSPPEVEDLMDDLE